MTPMVSTECGAWRQVHKSYAAAARPACAELNFRMESMCSVCRSNAHFSACRDWKSMHLLGFPAGKKFRPAWYHMKMKTQVHAMNTHSAHRAPAAILLGASRGRGSIERDGMVRLASARRARRRAHAAHRPAGTAKSELARRLHCLRGRALLERLLTSSRCLRVLSGPSPSAPGAGLRSARRRRLLPQASIAFIDEVFKRKQHPSRPAHAAERAQVRQRCGRQDCR